jgi:hypothetical protein
VADEQRLREEATRIISGWDNIMKVLRSRDKYKAEAEELRRQLRKITDACISDPCWHNQVSHAPQNHRSGARVLLKIHGMANMPRPVAEDATCTLCNGRGVIPERQDPEERFPSGDRPCPDCAEEASDDTDVQTP